MKLPIEEVWEAISHADRWPSWWKGVEKVERLEPGDEHGIGRVIRSTWKSKLPYRLVFESRTVEIQKPHTIEVEAIGELEGSGCWQLSQVGSITEVRYYWDVRTTKWWMNLLAPVARPLFRWNHMSSWAGEAKGWPNYSKPNWLAPSVHPNQLEQKHSNPRHCTFERASRPPETTSLSVITAQLRYTPPPRQSAQIPHRSASPIKVAASESPPTTFPPPAFFAVAILPLSVLSS